MGNREISPVARLVVGVIVYVAIVVGAIWMLGGEAWWLLAIVAVVVGAAASPFLGAGVVWLIVRRANRRNDPRHVEPPAGER